MLIKDVTEDELISRFLPHLPTAQNVVVPSGDDSAVFAAGGELAVSIDMLVEDRHFKTDWSTGRDVGYRAAQQNLADAVAMGAKPVSLVVGLGLPAELEVNWVEDFAKGLAEACEPLGVGVDGGDLVAADKITVSVTVLGDLEGRTPVRRSGAQLEDQVIFAGNLGHAIAGFHLLNEGYTREDDNESIACLVDDFLRPKPPLETVLEATRQHELHSLMDVSDGLIRDAGRMAAKSGLWFDLNDGLLRPFLADVAVAAGRLRADRRDWIFTGGEDHGFIATIAKDAEVPEGFTRIGRVMGASRNGRVTISGRDVEDLGGWDHFHGGAGAAGDPGDQRVPGVPMQDFPGFIGGSGSNGANGGEGEWPEGMVPFSTPM